MNASFEDARLILEKWKNSSALIAIVSDLANVCVRLTGRIFEIEGTELRIECGGPNYLAVDLGDCVFQYGDPREFPQVESPSYGHSYEHFLVIQYPPKELVILFEISEEHQRAQSYP